jgi:hypothetical protein
MRTHVSPRSVRAVVTGGVMAALMGIAASPAFADQQQVFVAQMSGAEVVPPPGDPDGTGTAVITTDREASTVCVDIHTENVIDPGDPYGIISGIVIMNVGAYPSPSDPGAIAVVFSTWHTSPEFEGCRPVAPDLIKEMRKYPHRFSVEVSTLAYVGGAVRGQFTEA